MSARAFPTGPPRFPCGVSAAYERRLRATNAATAPLVIASASRSRCPPDGATARRVASRLLIPTPPRSLLIHPGADCTLARGAARDERKGHEPAVGRSNQRRDTPVDRPILVRSVRRHPSHLQTRRPRSRGTTTGLYLVTVLDVRPPSHE